MLTLKPHPTSWCCWQPCGEGESKKNLPGGCPVTNRLLQTSSRKNDHVVAGEPQVKPHMDIGPRAILEFYSCLSNGFQEGKESQLQARHLKDLLISLFDPGTTAVYH